MNVSASTGGGPISALWCVPPCPLRPLCPGWVCTNVSRLLSTLFPWLLGTGLASVGADAQRVCAPGRSTVVPATVELK